MNEKERTFTSKELIERIKGRGANVLIRAPWGDDVPMPKGYMRAAALRFGSSMWKVIVRDDGILILERVGPAARV